MNHSDVQAWLDRYVEAWRRNELDPILDLFTEDASYSYRPYGGDAHTVVGREAIAESWLESPDEPGSWEAHYEPFAVDGHKAVAVGSSRYLQSATAQERTYSNAYLLEFSDDGRCSRFVEFYMLNK